MNAPTRHPETEADRQADRWAMIGFVIFMLASLVIQATSIQLEARQARLEPWLREGASHLALLCLVPFFPLILDIAPLSLRRWRWSPLQVHQDASAAGRTRHTTGRRRTAHAPPAAAALPWRAFG